MRLSLILLTLLRRGAVVETEEAVVFCLTDIVYVNINIMRL